MRWTVVIGASFFGTIGGVLARAAVAFESRRRGATGLQIGLLTAAFLIVRGLGAPVAGWLSDRAEARRPFALAGLALLLGATALLLLVPGVWGLVGLRALQGLGAAFLWPILQTIVAETATAPATALSAYFATGQLGHTISYGLYGKYLAGHFAASIGAALVFLGLTLVGLLIVRGASPRRSPPAPASTSPPTARSGAETAKATKAGPQPGPAPKPKSGWGPWRGQLWLYGASMLSGGVIGLSADLFLIYLSEIVALGEAGATTVLFFARLLAQGLMFGTARLAERGHLRLSVTLCFLLAGLGSLGVAIPTVAVAVPATVLMMGGAFSFTPISRYLAGRLTPDHLGTRIGLLNMTGNLGGVLAPLVGGALFAGLERNGLPANPWFWLGLVLLGWTAWLWLKGRPASVVSSPSAAGK